MRKDTEKLLTMCLRKSLKENAELKERLLYWQKAYQDAEARASAAEDTYACCSVYREVK